MVRAGDSKSLGCRFDPDQDHHRMIKMKIVVEIAKPRAKRLNDTLRSKRCERHADARKPNRQQLKKEHRRALLRFDER